MVFNYVITDEVGIHARPAGLLVKAAKEVGSKVTVTCNGKSADAKKLMAIMSLGVTKGMEDTVAVEGDNEAADGETIKKFFEDNL